jgi:hypothetical protein
VKKEDITEQLKRDKLPLRIFREKHRNVSYTIGERYAIGTVRIKDKYKSFVIDTEDFPTVSKYTWCYDGHYFYAKLKPDNEFGRDKATIKLHQVIAINHDMVGNYNPEKYIVIDHKNGCPKDNRSENLRVVTLSENVYNRSWFSKNNTGLVGIWKDTTCSPNKDKYRVTLFLNGQNRIIARYDTLEEAILARIDAYSIFYNYPLDFPIFWLEDRNLLYNLKVKGKDNENETNKK